MFSHIEIRVCIWNECCQSVVTQRLWN